ncbi:MAG: rRNA pseudouridine synthase [Treponema sp.]|nr:rRNA pseudouridine synthase [Treponema sp.]
MKMKQNDSNLPVKSPEAEKEVIRLQVYLAHAGVASRRASEEVIASGRVKVNGIVVTEMGAKVSVHDKIEVDGKLIGLEENKRYILLNKPEGCVCSSNDEKGRQIAGDLLKEKYSERLYNVGRLDMFSRGIIFYTNDGDFAAKLSHPSSEIEKEYIVVSTQDIPDALPENFRKGIRIDNIFYRAKIVEKINERKCRIVLLEGKNREIRNVFEYYNIPIRSLTRVRIGNVNLDQLPPGESRELSASEVASLLSLCSKNSSVGKFDKVVKGRKTPVNKKIKD